MQIDPDMEVKVQAKDEKHEVGDGSCFLEWPHSLNMHCLKSGLLSILK